MGLKFFTGAGEEGGGGGSLHVPPENIKVRRTFARNNTK